MTDYADVVRQIALLRAEVRELREEGRERRDVLASRRSLSASDTQRLQALLPAVFSVFGTESFLARDLSDDDAAGAVRNTLEDLSPKQIGRLLARAEGLHIAGFTVKRTGHELNTALWRVTRISNPANPHADPQTRSNDVWEQP